MNILFLNSTRVKAWGGIEKWMLMTAKGLHQRGHTVYCGGKSNSLFVNRCIEAGFRTYSLKFGIDFSIINSYRLSKIFRHHQIDIVINHYNKEIKMASIARKFSRRPIIIVARAGLANVHNNWRYRHTYKHMVDGVITNTKAIKKKYLSYGWMEDDFIRVIQNGVDINVSANLDIENLRQTYNFPKRRPVIGIFGRLVPQKQHNLFLDVAKNILDEYPEAIFPIVGYGPLKDKIQQYACDLGINDSVFMVGFQTDLEDLYHYCDIVLLTSAYEGVPNVLIEAMLVGRPVVAFDVGGVNELIQSGKTGIIVPFNDVTLMTKKTLELLKSAEVCKSLGSEASKFIRENISIEKMVNSIEHYLKELLACKSGGKT